MSKLISAFVVLCFLNFMSFSNCFARNSSQASYQSTSCLNDPALQLARSNELQRLLKADQADRENWKNLSEDEMSQLSKNDLIRRKQVGEIFAEGCFKDAKDYTAAAMIYQHGDTPDHYYQAFIWSKRAAELGDIEAQSFSALAIDRYLLSREKKQLFGSQYQKTLSGGCFCMRPVEQSFPDDVRKEYSGRSLSDNYKIMASFSDVNCSSVECSESLEATPKGSIIGLW